MALCSCFVKRKGAPLRPLKTTAYVEPANRNYETFNFFFLSYIMYNHVALNIARNLEPQLFTCTIETSPSILNTSRHSFMLWNSLEKMEISLANLLLFASSELLAVRL
jgi:hypothetical protein